MRETMDEILTAQNRIRKTSMALIAVLAVSIIMILMKIRIPGLVLGVAAMAFYFGWVRWQSHVYSRRVTEASILHGLAAGLENPAYLGKKGLTAEELDQAAMLPVQTEKGSLLVFQGFEGKTEGNLIRGWETTFRYRRGPGRTDVAFLSGTLITCSYETPLADRPDWVAIRKGLVNDQALQEFLKGKSYSCCVADHPPFDEKFCLAVRNQGSLSEGMKQELITLCENQDRVGAVRCTAEQVMIFLDHRFYTDRVKVQQPLTEEQILRNPLPERDDVWNFFRNMQRKEEKES